VNVFAHKLYRGIGRLTVGVVMLAHGALSSAASYTYDDTVPFAWETASTDVVWARVDTGYPIDDDQQQVSIGFTFNFGGTDYTQLRILSNGVLHFGANQGFQKDYTNEALPITTVVNGPGFEEPADRVIAPYWDDLEPSRGGTVRYSLLGSAPNRRFVVSWESVPHYQLPGRYTTQVILYENGNIKFQYGGGATTGRSATIGVEVNDTDFTQYSYNTNSVANRSAILFSPTRHFAISHDGAGDLCTADNITISRHYGSHIADTSAYTGTIDLSTSTGNGVWSLVTGSGSFTNLGGGNARYTYAAADAGQVVLGLANSVAETLNINVTDGTDSEDPSEDADMVFASAASATFRDVFAAVSYSGNDGTNNWSGPWTEVSDNGSPNNGDIRIHNDTTALWLEFRGNGGGNGDGVSEWLWREADLSGFAAGATATLSFDYRRIRLDNANDYLTIEVSSNGGASWTELGRFSGRGNDATYTTVSYDISAYMAANTRIRFLSSPRLGRNDRVYIDNVQIAVAWAAACPGTDHFVIGHDGLGIHCLAEPVSVTAKLADGSTDTTYTGTITLDTQSGTGSWSLLSGNGSFVDSTANDGLASYTFDAADNGVATFNLDYRSGSASIDVDAYDGTVRDDDSEGNLLFSASGFTVTAAALNNPPPGTIDTLIPPQTAATDFQLYLAAYGTTPSDPACGIIETYTGAKNLKFWSSYDNPTTGTLPVTVNGVDAFASEVAADAGTAQAVTFSNGQAAVTVNYADVGQITLAMKDDTVTADLPTGIRGTSSAFVVKPAGFVLSAIRRSSDGFANPGTAVDENGAPFIAAGADFSVTVTALNSAGNPTPNYGRETSPESVLLTPTLVAAGAANNPAIAFTTGFDGFVNGEDTGTDFRWDEVGIITLTPSVADGDYLGAGDVTGTTSANVGRFYPDHFITATTNGSFANACTAFTYVGQSFGYLTDPTLTATAQSAVNSTTANYTGAWARLTASGVSLNYPAADNSQLDQNGSAALGVTSTVGTPSRTDNGDGSLSFALGAASADSFVYDRSLGQVAPFTSDLTISLTAVSDGEASASDLATPRAITPVGNQQRFGRGYALDAYGTMSQLGDSLTLSIGSRYFDASGGWTLNTDDSCSTYSYTKTDTDITTTASSTSPVSLVAGVGDLTLTISADAGSPGGSSQLSTTWSSWLQYDLDGVDQLSDGNRYDDNPSATATFGIFRGDDRFLFWREAP